MGGAILTHASPLLGQVASDAVRLNAGGMAIMALSILLVLSLLGFCIYRLVSGSHPEHLHAPLDIDTHDTD